LVDQIPKADDIYRDLVRLLGRDRVAVWTSDHDVNCKERKKVLEPAAQHSREDLAKHVVAVVTHKFYSDRNGHMAKNVLQNGELQPRALTFVDEQPEQVTVYDVQHSDIECLRDLVKDDTNTVESVGPHLDALARFTFPKTLGGSSIEKASDAPEAWSAADDLRWFVSAAAREFVEAHRDAPGLERVFSFARKLVEGRVFVARDFDGRGQTHFMGYERNLLLSPGMVLLDATAEIDGAKPLCPWRTHHEVPDASYANLGVAFVPSCTRERLAKYFRLVKNRTAYARWIIDVIREHVQPGGEALVVCQKTLFDNRHVPDWPHDSDNWNKPEMFVEDFGWVLDGRKLAATWWGGPGVGANHWKRASVVLLFDEFHIPRRATIAKAQGLTGLQPTKGPLASLRSLRSKAPLIDNFEEGQLLRHLKQMSLRGNGRNYDEHGVCGKQKLVICAPEPKRLLTHYGRLFPGARPPLVGESTSKTREQQLYEILSRPGLPDTLTTQWVGQQMKTNWGDVSKNLMHQESVQNAIANLGWEYRRKRGRRGGSFVRKTALSFNALLSAMKAVELQAAQ
jgi:hypothetical protein